METIVLGMYLCAVLEFNPVMSGMDTWLKRWLDKRVSRRLQRMMKERSNGCCDGLMNIEPIYD